jgi:hypothetical protein
MITKPLIDIKSRIRSIQQLWHKTHVKEMLKIVRKYNIKIYVIKISIDTKKELTI